MLFKTGGSEFCFGRQCQAVSGHVVQCNDGPDIPGWSQICTKF